MGILHFLGVPQRCWDSWMLTEALECHLPPRWGTVPEPETLPKPISPEPNKWRTSTGINHNELFKWPPNDGDNEAIRDMCVKAEHRSVSSKSWIRDVTHTVTAVTSQTNAGYLCTNLGLKHKFWNPIYNTREGDSRSPGHVLMKREAHKRPKSLPGGRRRLGSL